MNWFQRRFHTCETPNPDTFAPILGREWTCSDCDAVWVYECRFINVEKRPAVWDQWADIQKEPITAWWKKE